MTAGLAVTADGEAPTGSVAGAERVRCSTAAWRGRSLQAGPGVAHRVIGMQGRHA